MLKDIQPLHVDLLCIQSSCTINQYVASHNLGGLVGSIDVPTVGMSVNHVLGCVIGGIDIPSVSMSASNNLGGPVDSILTYCQKVC